MGFHCDRRGGPQYPIDIEGARNHNSSKSSRSGTSTAPNRPNFTDAFGNEYSAATLDFDPVSNTVFIRAYTGLIKASAGTRERLIVHETQHWNDLTHLSVTIASRLKTSTQDVTRALWKILTTQGSEASAAFHLSLEDSQTARETRNYLVALIYYRLEERKSEYREIKTGHYLVSLLK
jgi:hypothetical protein